MNFETRPRERNGEEKRTKRNLNFSNENRIRVNGMVNVYNKS